MVDDQETAPTRAYVETLKAEIDLLRAQLAAVPPAPETAPIETRNEEAGFVEFVNDDRPYIVRDIPAPAAVLVDMETRHVIGYRIYDPEGIPPVHHVEPALDEDWIARFAAWNLRTFGPGMRTAGTVDHIRKECREIEANPTDPKEWVDIILLGINGLVRQGHTPAQIIAEIHGKHEVNEARTWPDWRATDPNQAIEHDRSQDAALKSEGAE